MNILTRSDYEFPRALWEFFPKNVDSHSIMELVRYQSPFLSQVILSKESRALISEISSSLLLFLDARFGENVPEMPGHSSLITTEFDPVGRTCSLYWLENRFCDIARELKVSDTDRKSYEEEIKPMISIRDSWSIAGSGATSKIYKCQYNSKPYALKVISAKALASGKQEIEILKKIGSHSNVCSMINHAKYSKKIKIVLPLYDMDARMLLNSSERVPVKTAVFIVHSILKALAYLESKRIIHADVKPANILLRKTKELEMEVALCDFGFSTQLEKGQRYCDAHPYGTESYLSPERRERNFGPKTDVWSLGITLFELLYHELPETNDGLVIPIKHNIPEAINRLLRQMISPVEKRLSAKKLLSKYIWEELMLSDWLKPEEMKEVKIDSRQLTSLPGPNVAGLVIGDKSLGKGGFGEVFEGYLRKEKERIKVAIKKIAKHKKLALKEVEQCMLIKSHKHLCKVYACSEDYEYFYIAMEFCPSNYRAFLKQKNPNKAVVAIHLEQILKGVYALYKQKIVHRDLKPANILLTSDNRIKIADFGLSKKLESSFGKHSNLGTPFYMAPEVFEKDYGRPVDIWSVGVIYLEMLGINIKKHFPTIQKAEPPNNLSRQSVRNSGNSSKSTDKPRDQFERVQESKAPSNVSTCSSLVDSHGDPVLSAFKPDGWIHKLRGFVETNITDPVSKEFLLSIFVIARKRPTAYQLLKKYQFTEQGLKHDARGSEMGHPLS